jgi:hypothetical protein
MSLAISATIFSCDASGMSLPPWPVTRVDVLRPHLAQALPLFCATCSTPAGSR